MKDYIEIINPEGYELIMKVNKLHEFLNHNLRYLDKTEMDLIREQLEAMDKYFCTLDARIDHAKLKEGK